uniref:Uncharacterized protein n=1 Tax=Rhizophora mucronata TaxID=61149 RepID=A0A2P2PIL6_RHIMU
MNTMKGQVSFVMQPYICDVFPYSGNNKKG